jgi:simple sugar transport system substrate-binding protein
MPARDQEVDMHGRIKAAAALASTALLLAACGGSSKPATSASGGTASSSAATTAGGGNCPYTFAVITHGDNGSFWSVVYKGAKNASSDLGCKLSEVYGSQQQGQAEPDDNAENAQLQDAINAHVDGIAISDHDPALMNPTIAKAEAAGIPVVMLNAGCDPADLAATHAVTCVGQPETQAGQASGQTFKSQGATNVLCVIHQSGQNLLDRCNGVAQGLGVGSSCSTKSAPTHGPACTELILSTPNAASNPQQAIGQVSAYLQAHPGVNAVMTLNSAIADSLVSAHPSGVKIATFDLDPTVVTDLKAGSLDFAVDQQQYLQGYLPIVALYLFKKHEGNSVAPDAITQTGPLIVTKNNVAKVSAAIASGDD